MASLEQALNLAIDHYRGKRLDQCEMVCRQVLAAVPDEPNALHLLGVMALNANRHDEAVDYLGRASRQLPQEPTFRMSFGLALKAVGRLDDAIGQYREALRMDDTFVEVMVNLGNALNEKQRYEEAAVVCARAVQLQPNLAAAHMNLGNALRALGRSDEAVASHTSALKINPDDARVLQNLGNALRETGRLDEAESHFRRAIAGNAQAVEAHVGLARVLIQTGRFDEAHDTVNHILQHWPDHEEAHNQLGLCLMAKGQTDESIKAFERAVALQPYNIDVRSNLASAMVRQHQYQQAMYHLAHVLSAQPEHVDALVNMAVAKSETGSNHEAIRLLERALHIDLRRSDIHARLIFMLDMDPATDADKAMAQRRRFDEMFAKPLLARAASHNNDADAGRRLRIGYVSADFCRHSAATAFGPVIRSHDKSQVHVTCYANGRRRDAVTEQLKAAADVWHDVAAMSDDKLAELIREDRIDILVDLSGYSSGNRLLTFARKPAPVQVTAWGYATSTGLSAMDYFLADEVVAPAANHRYFTEQVVPLPCILCYEPFEDAPQVNALPALTNETVTFGCLNRMSKVSEMTLDTWASILKATPGSRLLIKDASLSDDDQRSRLMAKLKQRGIDPARVELQGRTGQREHLAAYNQIDIALDPFPHNGGVSTFEALWMGVPVVTLRGERVPERVGASILTALHRDDWVAASTDEYVAIAKRLSTDLDALTNHRDTLRGSLQQSAMCRHDVYGRAVEEAYRSMWRSWCARRAVAAA